MSLFQNLLVLINKKKPVGTMYLAVSQCDWTSIFVKCVSGMIDEKGTSENR